MWKKMSLKMTSIFKVAALMSFMIIALSCQQNVNLREAEMASPNTSYNLANSSKLLANDAAALSVKNILVFINYSTTGSSCNGINIGSFKIITNAHCFFGSIKREEWSSNIAIDKNQLSIRFLDKPSYSLKDASILDTKYIRSVTINPTLDNEVDKYKQIKNEAKNKGVNYPYYMAHDIAVIELDQDLLAKEKPLSLEASISFDYFKSLPKEVNLAPINFDPTNKENANTFQFIMHLSLSSYTRIDQKEYHPHEDIEVRGLTTKPDLAWFEAFYTVYKHSNLKTHMHHSAPNIKHGFVCRGDSGSPVFLYDKINTKFLLIGLLQGATTPNNEIHCSNNAYIIAFPFHYKWLNISP